MLKPKIIDLTLFYFLSHFYSLFDFPLYFSIFRTRVRVRVRVTRSHSYKSQDASMSYNMCNTC